VDIQFFVTYKQVVCQPKKTQPKQQKRNNYEAITDYKYDYPYYWNNLFFIGAIYFVSTRLVYTRYRNYFININTCIGIQFSPTSQQSRKTN